MLRIDWTGERFVHGAGDAQLWYEHAHRYALAVGLAEGRRVVDVGCGEGYGAAWLASRARSVIGVDVAPEAIAHARSSYQAAGLSFAVGDARQLDLPDGSADLVTCFETIEHVSNPGAVLDELARILAPAGILLVSTPDAAESDGQNPFHLHELTVAELARELDGRFTHRLMFGQRVSAASHLWPLDDRERFGTAAAAVLSGNGAVPRLTGAQQRAVYVVAVCSQQPLDDVPMAGPATLVDAGDELLTDLRGQLDRARGQLQADESELDARATALAAADDAAARARDQLRSYESELTSRARSLADADRDLAGARERLADLDNTRTELGQTRAALSATERERDQAARTAAVEAAAAQTRARALLTHTLRRERALSAAERDLRAAAEELAMQRESVAGRVLDGYRRTVERVLPRTSGRRRLYGAAHGLVRRTVGTGGTAGRDPQGAAGRLPAAAQVLRPAGAAAFTHEERPLVSIVIPIFGRLAMTMACLDSIAAAPTAVGYEVIVVDDASPDGSGDALAGIPGIRLLRHRENLGYLRSTNDGAAAARGAFLVMLNNDTTVTAGWLDALVDAADDPRVGAVGARLLYPDGSLSEAGGIVFADGTPWIYGRADDPESERYLWLREVDYCSAACLLVRRSTWERLGGFDQRYQPAYYEDTDLCMRIRSIGQQVVYQPRAVVVHEEGGSHGSDTTELGRRLRAQNHVKFIARWQDELPAQQLPGDVFRARRRGPDRAVLVVDHHLPTPDRDSGSVRMTRLLSLLQGSGRHVCFLPHNPVTYADYAEPLRQSGIEVGDHRHDLGRWLGELVGEVDLVVLSRPDVAQEFLPAIRRHLPHAVIAYDMVDYHALRERRRQILFDEQDALALADIVQDPGNPRIGQVESRMCREADIVIAVSDQEGELIRQAHPGAFVVAIPNIHDEPVLDIPFEQRRGFVFVGGYGHPPNRDAVHVLVTQIWPGIRQLLPDAALHLVGSNMTPDVAGLAGSGVVAHGWVPDLSTVLGACRVFLAPLRYGAGLKGKVGQAMSAGLPVMTTSVGAEGMDIDGPNPVAAPWRDTDAEDLTTRSPNITDHDAVQAAALPVARPAAHLCVEDDLGAFAQAALALHEDKARWMAQVATGRAYVEHWLSPTAVTLRVEQLLQHADKVLADPGRRPGERPSGG